MTKNKEDRQDERIEKIYNLLIKYTTSDFSAREEVSEKADELDAIIVGLNTLGEELQSSGKILRDFEKRINLLMEVLLQYTLMDFSKTIEISEAGDELDAISVGLNTLAEELNAAKESEIRHINNLELKAKEISKLNAELEDNLIELGDANKELEAFTYSVSHDLRSPLRAIHGYTRILSDNYADKFDPEGKNMMDSVMRNAKKMGELIDDLLAFSKTGRKEIQPSDLDMTRLAELALQEVKGSLYDLKTKITILPLPLAFGDYNLMIQVFVNLISNAIKYSAGNEKPGVEIGAIKKEERIIYYVKDNGSGFDMQYYDKLFGVFQRLHSSEEFEGTGVGLALVKRIITRHQGKIWAEAKPNKGATFYFTLNENK